MRHFVIIALRFYAFTILLINFKERARSFGERVWCKPALKDEKAERFNQAKQVWAEDERNWG